MVCAVARRRIDAVDLLLPPCGDPADSVNPYASLRLQNQSVAALRGDPHRRNIVFGCPVPGSAADHQAEALTDAGLSPYPQQRILAEAAMLSKTSASIFNIFKVRWRTTFNTVPPAASTDR